MTATAKGTVEAPGKNVQAKAGLNRSILEQRWGMMLSQLRYKAEWAGKKVVEVDPSFTSQTCSSCGVVCRAIGGASCIPALRAESPGRGRKRCGQHLAAGVDLARAETLPYGSAGWAPTPNAATFVVAGVSRLNPCVPFGGIPRRAGWFLPVSSSTLSIPRYPQARGGFWTVRLLMCRPGGIPRRAGWFLLLTTLNTAHQSWPQARGVVSVEDPAHSHGLWLAPGARGGFDTLPLGGKP